MTRDLGLCYCELKSNEENEFSKKTALPEEFLSDFLVVTTLYYFTIIYLLNSLRDQTDNQQYLLLMNNLPASATSSNTMNCT